MKHHSLRKGVFPDYFCPSGGWRHFFIERCGGAGLTAHPCADRPLRDILVAPALAAINEKAEKTAKLQDQ